MVVLIRCDSSNGGFSPHCVLVYICLDSGWDVWGLVRRAGPFVNLGENFVNLEGFLSIWTRTLSIWELFCQFGQDFCQFGGFLSTWTGTLSFWKNFCQF